MEAFATFFLIGAVILGLVLTPMFLRSRERMRLLDLVRSGAERGEPLPPELVKTLMTEPRPQRPSHIRDVRRGVVLLALALAVEIIAFCVYSATSLIPKPPHEEFHPAGAIGLSIAGFGAIPGCIGLAFLLLGLSAKKPEAA